MTWLVLLGIGSGLCWGVADFFGGVQSRRLPALAVAFWSQVAGALAVLALRGQPPVPDALAWGAALFYCGLAVGTMSVVALVAACGAVVPVLVGLARGQVPGAAAGAGILAALAGIVLVSLQAASGEPMRAGATRAALPLALGAAAGFGLFFVFLDGGSAVAGDVPLWTVAGAAGRRRPARAPLARPTDRGDRGDRPPRHRSERPLRLRLDAGQPRRRRDPRLALPRRDAPLLMTSFTHVDRDSGSTLQCGDG